jgi:hypothetical protein
LLWELAFLGCAIGTQHFGYFWINATPELGALSGDILAGITILLMLLQAILATIFLYALVSEPDDVKKKPVVIGNNVFIGTNSIICKGVVIPDEAIIPAGSVVYSSKASDFVIK